MHRYASKFANFYQDWPADITIGFGGVAPSARAADDAAPTADILLQAEQDDTNWILPAKTYAGNRYTSLRSSQT